MICALNARPSSIPVKTSLVGLAWAQLHACSASCPWHLLLAEAAAAKCVACLQAQEHAEPQGESEGSV